MERYTNVKVKAAFLDKNGIAQVKASSNRGQRGEDYNKLRNKPSINDVTLSGNKSLDELGIQPAGNYLTENDLTDYVKNTDYATSNNGGVVKVGSNGLNIDSSGNLYADIETYSDYQSIGNEHFIGKGTLENVITGKGLTTESYVDKAVEDLPYKIIKTTSSTPVILDELDIGIYKFVNAYNLPLGTISYKKSSTDIGEYTLNSIVDGLLYIIQKPSEVAENVTFAYAYSFVGRDSSEEGIYRKTIYKSGNNLYQNLSGLISKIMTLDDNQTITAKKTFNILPETSIVPTTDNQFVNKKYVDDNSSSMYLGNSNDTSFQNPIDITGLKKGVYIFNNESRSTLHIRATIHGVTSTTTFNSKLADRGFSFVGPIFLELYKDIDDNITPNSTLGCFSYSYYDYNNYRINVGIRMLNADSAYYIGTGSGSGYGVNLVLKDKNITITGTHTYNTLPQSSVVPSSNNQLVNKKYVDDSITSAITTALGGDY